VPAYPEFVPGEGQNVRVTLTNGSEIIAHYINGQWWVGLADQDEDAPLANEFVVSWEI
jgi:hypothetical protein